MIIRGLLGIFLSVITNIGVGNNKEELQK